MPNECFPDSDPSPSPRVVAWVRARLRRDHPHLSDRTIDTAILNAAMLMHPRQGRRVILFAARSCLPTPTPPPSPAPVPATDPLPLLELLQRWLPATEDPPDTERFNREILRRLPYRDAGEC
jgi:hypothetical protein